MIYAPLKPTLAKLAHITAILLLCSLAGCSDKSDVITADGQSIQLNNLHGKWLVVNYWASWCGHCEKELKDFDAFFQHNKNKVLVLGVNFGEMDNAALKTTWQYHFPVTAHFPIERYGVTHIDNLPRTYVFAPDGTLQKTLLGPQTESSLSKAVHLS